MLYIFSVFGVCILMNNCGTPPLQTDLNPADAGLPTDDPFITYNNPIDNVPEVQVQDQNQNNKCNKWFVGF